MKDKIIIKGARENNLKNIDLEIPKNKLVVITGVSGSGKSSLAFKTIYAEGQRRYLESLSSYARQFLGTNDKPDVDSIEGLCPAIAIDQKSTSQNPRSTVGTITEVYDYMRLLFARIGVPHCINKHGPIQTQTVKQIVDSIMRNEDSKKLILLSPLVLKQKGTHLDLLNNLRKEGYLRVRIDKEIYELDDEIDLDKNIAHTIELVIDRIVLHHDQQTRSRINDAVELSLNKSKGKIIVLDPDDNSETFYNEAFACNECGFSIKELEPRLFSFNSPLGACEHCKGLGFVHEPDEAKMIPEPELSINQGGIDFFKNKIESNNLDWQRFKSLLAHYKIDCDKPINQLSKRELDLILYGSDEPISIVMVSNNNRKYEQQEYIEGVLDLVKRRHQETTSEMAREFYSKYMSEKKCKACNGKRLNKAALHVLINHKNIIDLTEMDINQLIEFFLSLELNDQEKQITNLLLKEIVNRLTFLSNVGLEYLSLSRTANTLSGGESQRIRLASQLGSNLTGVLYVLDEPSIGLHQKDNAKLIETLKQMRDLGNSLVVVEHDLETIENADYIVDIGPGAGINGGYVTACGTYDELLKNPNSLTAKYLNGEKTIEIPSKPNKANGNKIVLKNATGNNLKNVTLTIPLGQFIAVTGVSGSGKSTLILQTLAKAIQKTNFNPFEKPLPYKEITGCHHVDKLVQVTQDPIGRTPRSNPATYVGVFDEIRDLFANLKESKEKGFTKSRFSFNIKGGRCEKCQGDGEIKIDMHFLPSIYIKCDECNGHKYNEETLSVRFKNKTIYDVLKLSIEEALEFFINFPSIHRKLQLLVDVGLGYLELGTSSTELSGGEAQRIKLAKFLQKRPTGKTMYILDEPTTGLHIDDIAKLIKILQKIVSNGDTVIVIEHNLDMIKVADHIIDIGPNGGIHGGQIVASGSIHDIIESKNSYTGVYLKEMLAKK